MKTSTLFKGSSEAKESVWKQGGDETTPRQLKSVIPGSQMSTEQRNAMLAKIKGQAAMSSLKEQLAAAESKSNQLAQEKQNLQEQVQLLKDQSNQTGDDYKQQL